MISAKSWRVLCLLLKDETVIIANLSIANWDVPFSRHYRGGLTLATCISVDLTRGQRNAMLATYRMLIVDIHVS